MRLSWLGLGCTFRLGFRRFDARWRRFWPRSLDRLRGLRRGRRCKLDRRRRGQRRLWPRRRKWLLDGRRRLFGDRRRWRLRRGKRGLLHGRRLLVDDRGRRRFGRVQRRLRLHGRRGRLICNGWSQGDRRRLDRSRRGVLSGWRRRLFERFWLFGRGRRRFCGRRLRLDVDDHLSGRLECLRRQRDKEEGHGVERDHDQDGERTEPRRPNWRLEAAPVQSCGGHGAGAFGAAEVGGLGAAGVGDTVRRGPDTIAIREIPLAARSSITDTTSP